MCACLLTSSQLLVDGGPLPRASSITACLPLDHRQRDEPQAKRLTNFERIRSNCPLPQPSWNCAKPAPRCLNLRPPAIANIKDDGRNARLIIATHAPAALARGAVTSALISSLALLSRCDCRLFAYRDKAVRGGRWRQRTDNRDKAAFQFDHCGAHAVPKPIRGTQRPAPRCRPTWRPAALMRESLARIETLGRTGYPLWTMPIDADAAALSRP